MPNGYEYSDVKLKDFEAALRVYLDELEARGRKDRGAWQTIIRNLPFGFGGEALEDVDDIADRLYDEIMRAVTMQGISPNVAASLGPMAAQIYNHVVSVRATYDWQKEHGERVADWQKEVQKAVSQDWSNQFAYEQLRLGQEWKAREHEFATEKWRVETEAAERQRQLEWDWRQKELEHEQWMTAENLKAQQAGLAARQFAGMYSEAEQPNREDFMRRIVDWEKRMSGIGGERNWIKRYMVERERPVWEQPKESPLEFAQKRLWDAEKAAGWIGRHPEVPWGGGTREAALEISRTYSQRAEEFKQEYDAQKQAAKALDYLANPEREEFEKLSMKDRQSLAAVGYQAMDGGTPAAGPPAATPETPEFLREMYGLGGRLPLKKDVSPVAPLSGQALGKMTPSQAQQWMGYAEYTGAKPEELIWQTQRMQPRTPQVAQRWAPRRQWR